MRSIYCIFSPKYRFTFKNWYSRLSRWCICFRHSSSTQGVTGVSQRSGASILTDWCWIWPFLPHMKHNYSYLLQTDGTVFGGYHPRGKVCCFLRYPFARRNPLILIKICQLQLCVCICLCFLGNLCCTLSPHDCFYCIRFLLLGTSLLTMITTTSTENAPVLYN